METFRGSRHEIGVQVGKHFAKTIREFCVASRESPPPFPAEECSARIVIATRLTEKLFPWLMEEIKGVAEGAGVSVSDFVLSQYEDLWDMEGTVMGCTDIAALGKTTASGRLLVGHNNDGVQETPPPQLIRFEPIGEPAMTAASIDGWGISFGANSAGLVLSGNQVTANDIKAGVPRAFLCREYLAQRNLVEGYSILAHKERASGYNNVIADDRGNVFSLELSGTEAHLLGPDEFGILSHSNHYLHPDMSETEAKEEDLVSTGLREQRTCRLLHQTRKHTLQTFAEILSDHEGYPISICRHHQGEIERQTIASVIFEPEKHQMWFLQGQPCKGQYQQVRY